MRNWNTVYQIDEEITFRASHFYVREEKGGLICSLEGEFLKEGSSFDPPMRYEMTNVGVISRNPVDILYQIYSSLNFEREKRAG